MKNTISESEYFSLIGLLTLAGQHLDALTDIEQSVQKVLKDKDDKGFIFDAVYAAENMKNVQKQVDQLLENLNLKVKK